jgi:hypothetical protein
LTDNGIRTKLFGITTGQEIDQTIEKSNKPVSHVIVEAPFIPTQIFSELCNKYHDIRFLCRSHSQISFLSVDPGAFKLIREYSVLEESCVNFNLVVNNIFMGEFIQYGYGKFALYLPNLYFNDRTILKHWRPLGNSINLGSFGSARVGKNHLTAIAAALIFKESYGCEVNFYMNSGRDEQTGILGIAQEMVRNVPGFNLKFIKWDEWPNFRHWMQNLNCHIQLSSTESFNLCTADAASVQIPTCCGPAISWLSDDFKVNIDSPHEAAMKIHHLVSDPYFGQKALTCLNNYQKQSLQIWIDFLTDKIKRTMPERFH